jgi:multiple sugar transport system substrate-binding protein
MSQVGFDTYTSLRMFLDAHDVGVVNEAGQFLLELPENRQRFINALTEYTNFYLKGYVPPTATEWTGSGNNTMFLDGGILMTQNLTLSIPLTQKLTHNQYNQDALERYQQIVTIDRPLKLDGTELLTRKGIKQAIVPKASKNQAAAKEFLSYLIYPDNLNQLIQGFKGRIFPVMPELLKDSFWSNASDLHLSSALKIYNRPSLIPYEVMHSAFSEVQNQQLWAKTVLKVIQEKVSPTTAVDWAIAQIKTIWTAWEG